MVNVQIDTVENGLEAYNSAIQNSYDFIIMDINMPIMGGVEALKKIRRSLQDNWVPIIN